MAPFLFLGFWILIGVALVFIGLRGGPGGARETLQSQTRGSRRFAAAFFAVVFVGLGLVVPALLLAGNHDKADKHYRGAKLTGSDGHGREVFRLQCATCHTLAAAKAAGKVGPNLDVMKPTKSFVLDAIVHGRIRGNGTMPARLVTGHDADAVASFVSKVAGR
jgi:mono/diheme cytochrome c family protein